MGLIGKLINEILIAHNFSGEGVCDAYDSMLQRHGGLPFSVKAKDKHGKEKDFELNFIPVNNFDKNRKTMVIFHGNGTPHKDKYESFGRRKYVDYNYFVVEYLPHKYRESLKDFDVNLELMVDTSKQMIHHLDNVLSLDQYYGSDYKRDENLILYCYSLGSMVGTKVAARIAKENGNKKSFYAVLNYCSPVNVNLYLRTHLVLFITVNALIAVLGFLPAYGIGMGVFFGAVHHDLNQAAKLSLIPAFVSFLVVFVVSSLIVMHKTKKLGIEEADVKDLKNDSLYFVSFEGDGIAPHFANKKILEYSEGNKDTKIALVKKSNNIGYWYDPHNYLVHNEHTKTLLNLFAESKGPLVEGVYFKHYEHQVWCGGEAIEHKMSLEKNGEMVLVDYASVARSAVARSVYGADNPGYSGGNTGHKMFMKKKNEVHPVDCASASSLSPVNNERCN